MSSSPGVPDREGHKESQIIDILGTFLSVGGDTIDVRWDPDTKRLGTRHKLIPLTE